MTNLSPVEARLWASCLATTILVTSFLGSHAIAWEVGDATPNLNHQPTTDQSVDDDSASSAHRSAAVRMTIAEDATAEDLFHFIRRAKRERGRTKKSTIQSARAVAKAATSIRQIEGITLQDELRAIREQLAAMMYVGRFDLQTQNQRNDLLAALDRDPRPEISRIAAVEEFKTRIRTARGGDREDHAQLMLEFKQFVAGHSFDRDCFQLGSALAREIGGSGNTELAATLYEDLAAIMQQSDDDAIRQRSIKMVGAARRMRLPGNFMELSGTTSDGQPFQWDDYRGKVVLVDFWASWCRACREAIPNRLRNLERYREKGFEIVGVNLDRTVAACNKYVEGENIPWTNLVSSNEAELGWDNPLATMYGISFIPAAILVDQDGKVVSFDARGDRLDALLQELLGDPVQIDAAEPSNASHDQAVSSNRQPGSEAIVSTGDSGA